MFSSMVLQSSIIPPTPGQSNGQFTFQVSTDPGAPVKGAPPFTIYVNAKCATTTPVKTLTDVSPISINGNYYITISGLSALGPDCIYWLTVVDINGCSTMVDVNLAPPTGTNTICTFTQGYYGNPGGKNTHTMAILADLANSGGSIIIGTLGHSIIVNSATAVLNTLPGGGSSQTLAAGNIVLGSPQFTSVYGAGRITNSLLAQTIALGLNLSIPSNLLGFVPLNGLVSPSVISAVQAAGFGSTVSGLYAFANHALGGGTNLSGLSLSNINDAVTAINERFDECKSFTFPGAKPMVMSARSPAGMETMEERAGNAVLSVAASPNPFRGNLKFVIKSKVSGQSELSLYNITGAKVAVPFIGYVSADRSQTVDYKVPSTLRGGLFYVLKVGDKTINGKLISAQ